MENILLIRLKSIGDVAFTLPAVNAVRDNFPAAKITFLTSRENAPLLRGFRDVDEVIALDRAAFLSKNPKNICGGTFALLHRLRAPEFSRAIDFQGYGETELLSWWSGAAERWGCVYHPPRGWLYTLGVARSQKIHPADWNLFLLEQAGMQTGKVRNEFVLPAESLDEGRRFFAANNLDCTRPTLFLQPFTSSPNKDWPLENFLAGARHWQSRGGQVLFGGGPSERARLELARAAGFAVAAGVPLLVSAGLVKLSTLVVGADTGLLHIAVALGRRVVMIMASNAPGSTHPFRHADWTITPAAGKTISEIPASAVIAAGERAVSGPAGNVSC